MTPEELRLKADRLDRKLKSLPPVEKKQHNPLSFSQRMVTMAIYFSFGIVGIMVGLNFFLLLTGREPMSQETITAITVYGGVTSGVAIAAYGVVSGWKADSENKHCKGDHSKYLDFLERHPEAASRDEGE